MKKVLVVDDSRFMYEEIVHFLEDSGFEACAFCRDAEKAMLAYNESAPDVVLMDIVLPGIDGLEATAALLARWPAARVVMISSLAYDNTVEGARKGGARGFLCKPFTREELLAVLAEVTDHAADNKIGG